MTDGVPGSVSPVTKQPRSASSATPDHKTRVALLEAGIAVAEEHGLAGLSVNRVVERAKVAKGTFYVHFSDRAAFIDALHARFYLRIGEALAVALADLPPGVERLSRGIEVYLDACLADRAVKALLLEARTDGSLTAVISARQAGFAALAEPSFRALDWPDPATAARLMVAMASEAALVELEAGRKRPAARLALRRFLGG